MLCLNHVSYHDIRKQRDTKFDWHGVVMSFDVSKTCGVRSSEKDKAKASMKKMAGIVLRKGFIWLG